MADVKPWYKSKTVWVNIVTAVVSILTAPEIAALVKDHPEAAVYITAVVAAINIILRTVTSAKLSAKAPPPSLVLIGLLCLPSSVLAQARLMSPEKDAALRASIPPIEDEALAAKIAEATLYTDAEIPPAYQFQPLAGGVGMQTTVLYSPDVQLNRIRKFTNGNKEFPWRTPGGVDFAEQQCDKFRFIWLPKRDDGTPWPLVVYRDHLEKSDSVNMPIPLGYKWVYPLDTVLGEVLVMNFSDGLKYTFEMRLRIREVDDWEVDIYRPFPTLESLKQAVSEIDPTHPLLARLDSVQIELQTMRDQTHQRSAFQFTAGVFRLPPIEPSLSKTLLTNATFRSAMAKAFAEAGNVQAFAPTATHAESIVPANYLGTFMGSDRESCRNCHKHVMKHVDRFDNSDWYGHVRGGDGIFTFHPFSPACIGPPDKQVQLRSELVQAGMVEPFDQRRHPSTVYRIAPAYDPRPTRN